MVGFTYSLQLGSKRRTASAVNSVYLFGYDWIHLQTAIVKEGSVSRQSSTYLLRYGWIHLHFAIAKEDSVSRQSSTYSDMVGFTYFLQ
jgi:hypothetical protein